MRRIKYSRYPYNRMPDGIFVANELYTATELNKFYIPLAQVNDIFEEVIVKKTETYWFFGCRFEYGKGPNTYE
jgi:hypothetical protein